MDASSLYSLLEGVFTKNDIATNSTAVTNFLNVTSTALADVPSNVSLPFFGDVLGLGLSSGNFSLSSLNSTVITSLLSGFIPVFNDIPANTTATIIQYTVAMVNTLNLTVSSSSSSGLKSFLTSTVLPSVLSLPANDTSTFVGDVAAALAYIPQSTQIPYLQKVLLYAGSHLSSLNGSAISTSDLSPYIAELNIPTAAVVPLVNNTVVSILSMPLNESKVFYSQLVSFYDTVPSNNSMFISQKIKDYIFPSNGTITLGVQFFLSMFNELLLNAHGNASPRSGTLQSNQITKKLLGTPLPPQVVHLGTATQTNLFGDYPTSADIAPSAIFAAVFMIFAFAHLGIFYENYRRGHKFWLSLGFAFYCVCRFIGWVIRIVWSSNPTNVQLGSAGGFFTVSSSVFLLTLNLILAQRIFTWMHPVGGSRKLFWYYMYALYFSVIVVIALTSGAQISPYLSFMSPAKVSRLLKVTEASSILLCLYCFQSLNLVAMAYQFKPTKKDKNLYTYQAWWIEKFSPFYYVEKGAAQQAEESFLERSVHERNAVRVIRASVQHAQTIPGVSTERGALNHTFSVALLAVTSVLISVGAICRCISIFQNNTQMTQTSICKPVVMYICYGLLEVICNILYLVGRIDLRFYRPDRLPKRIREAPEVLNKVSSDSHSEDLEKDLDVAEDSA
ncbi:hypothetical protein CLIB1423_04S00870 [[Candida] railenensis]|uniref:Uncharacterized protein n=1 Tax=[Candida] railenensis TaxID=45579 RepID=A0A9P0QN95_9ASCO|nr:hypothetical protein CLIB1423_04S00870 [[Candida] railenensis]